MPTPHRRLGIVRDREFEDALAQTRLLLGPRDTRSAAAHVRALALRGARALRDESGAEGELRRRIAERHGLIPARAGLASLRRPEEELDSGNPTPASDALRWARGE